MGWQDRFSLHGRKALITGASKGIGPEIAAGMSNAAPARRFAKPVEVADASLTSPASRRVNGALSRVKGGFTSV